MIEKFKDGNMSVPAYIWGGSDCDKTLQQIRTVCEQSYMFKHMAVMPDNHLGYGLCIGGVAATKGVIVPNFVGLDIGCGVTSCRLPIKKIDRSTIMLARRMIKAEIPMGFKHHTKMRSRLGMPSVQHIGENSIVWQEYDSARCQLGTLGGGNHFIEIQRGSDGYIYLMLHSGSRNLGNKVAKHYHGLAVEKMNKYHTGVPKDLSFLNLNSEDGQNYLTEMKYCVEFAAASRKHMLNKCLDIMTELCSELIIGKVYDIIDVAHNYADIEHHFGEDVWVHRKGATRAREGDIGLIPGDMGSHSYIVEGLGNAQSFNSCSHGAGRTMSRAKAKSTLDLDGEQDRLDKLGIVHDMRSVGKLDESPGSYKDIEEVMESQNDLVKIKTTLTPLGGIKG